MRPDINTYVRPIITLILTGVFCYGFIVRLIPTEAFVTIATTVLVWWFKARDEQKKG